MSKYDHLTKDELTRLLDARDQRDTTKFGLVWEANEIERDKAINSDFVALDLIPDQSVGTAPWRNLIIEGDNFDALRYLRMTHAGQVKCIYIDPPYNTGNRDFVYNDRFIDTNDSWRHSTWCEFMYQRLMLAKDMLRQDGVIFVSIDDNEIFALGMLMNKVFGIDNFLATLVWEKGKKGDSKFFSVAHEYILAFACSKNFLTSCNTVWRRRKAGVDDVLLYHTELRKQYGSDHDRIRSEMMKWFRALPAAQPAKQHKHYNWSDDRGLYFAADFAGPDDGRESRPRYDILHPTTKLPCKKPSTGWRWEESRTLDALKENPPLIHFGPDETTIPCRKSYLGEVISEPFPSVIYKDGRAATLQVERLLGKGVFNFPKDVEVLEELIRLVTNPGDLVLDFFAGSGTTGHAILNLNAEDGGRRRFILVSNTEATETEPGKNICRDVCAKRVSRVIEGMGESAGLDGNFAYLYCRRHLSGHLLDIEHAQVWTALQLIHRETLESYTESDYLWAGNENQALVYVPRFAPDFVGELRKRVKLCGEVVIYSWQPETLKQHIRAGHVLHEAIPESLARRFGMKG